MKTIKKHFFLIINIVYLVIVVGVSIYGFINLPDEVATQIGLSGKLGNMVPKTNYLIGALIIITLLSVLGMTRKEKEQKIKYFVACTICVIAHIAMIVAQL